MERQESLLFPLGNRFSHFYQSLLRLPLANVGEGGGEGEGKAKQGIEGSHRTRESGGGPIPPPSFARGGATKERKEGGSERRGRKGFFCLARFSFPPCSFPYLPTSFSLSIRPPTLLSHTHSSLVW